ncbi:MAG: hypothetical protein GTN89_02200 [Acidobacteria bacterium]|nr:hypothetical protein [Acidobacteriota bacterium]NIM61762.1 hypothetical protein [Acidobacteriota bacterium]NIO60006.1 hypothetical protein [Acidobacteriota bacterium]NIQ29198.1 hypothetical protein [Acidobacteriota bacterium]NIQ83772.1 hypothetical protein [Acidobacteriota bacterium]
MSAQERLLDLLASRATEGLSEEDAMELDGTLHQLTGLSEDDLELAAAAADLAFVSDAADVEPMPDHLKHRIMAQARDHLESRTATVTPFPQPLKERTEPGFPAGRYLGWYVAAAILILALWAPWSTTERTPTPAPTLSEQRETLLGGAADTIRVAWTKPEIPEYAGVEGDVVWSNERQAGFMRLKGLPPNRSDVAQYQLWIVDPSRDERPIDGGVFDIPAGMDEVIVPIDAKLRAISPAAFAITLEQPGGVVVSDGPLLVVAPVDA